MEINIATSGLGLKEKHIHDIYCLSKTNTNSSNFVYNSSKQIYRILDAYCGDSHTKKPPLLVIGIPLTGKSSLLSNWFTLRRNKKNEIPTISRYSQDEFIFWHSVGSTRSSCYEVNLIHRLFNDLNEYFDLSREVPINSDRLRWVLPRLLQTASHKGRMVIIIIDGIDRLVPDDDNESLLSWLPLEPLSNVKIILSATVPLDSPLFRNKEGLGSDTTTRRASVDINPSDSWSRLGKLESKALIDTFEYECTQRSGIKLLRMLERRPLQVLRLRHLEKKQPERLLLSFIKKTVDIDSVPSSIDDNVSLGVSDADLVSNHHRKSRNDVDLLRSSPNEDIKRISGFLLFPCHLQALLSNRLGSNAYFMRLVLVFSYSFSRLRGCSIWPLWSQLTSTEDIPSLLDTIFQFIESPTLTETTSRTQETELELLRSCGGLETLIDVYPWLSSLQSLKEEFHTRSEDSSSQSTSSKSTTTTSLQVTARQTSASESKQGLGLQDLMRRASSAMVSPARNKLQVSANQVSMLFNVFILLAYL